MTFRRLHHQSGIALGPILFIIAVLAVLVAAIAAGGGGFSESAKAMRAFLWMFIRTLR